MDTVGQSYNIIVTGANNDTRVRRNCSMEADKVAPIKRQHRSASCGRKCQDGSVFDALACLASLVGGKHIMAKLTQASHNGIAEILVYVQPDHQLRVCRLLDGSINLLAMRGIVGPDGV
jgi:hypothetical protein